MRVLVLVALLLLTACSSPPGGERADAAEAGERPPLSELTPLENPRAHEGPSTALVADADVVPVERPVPVLPVTVTDNQDTEVTVTSADRILALDVSGTLAATVFGLGLGDRVVGRDVSTGFPSARHLPLVTVNGHQLNAEALMGLKPTVVLTDTTLGPWDAVLQLRDAGVPVVVLDPKRDLSANAPIVRAVAKALGVPDTGEKLVRRMESEIAETIGQIGRLAPDDPARKLRVVFLYLRGQAGVYYLFGKGSGADSLIQALGAVDVATESGLDGMRPINPEALAKAKPDVILMMTDGLRSVGGVDNMMSVPGVAQTPAAQKKRFVDMDDSVVLGFGPKTAAVLDGLARALYAP
ncbi:iron complex transport system substrate-binding protein [Lentzea fradiae]|uniref:Iron complex transport system substrate-binding protein n=1 Tax=Lentzea fradiae TaxID=200378 RepID=A0A1G7R3V9_9PSEU|nr:ABC transporter substrate-binding protein [Lentzea fradiae]SDG05456.1 iron complex transport system substrate-binding protein [Lentzea fradiae]